MRPCGLPVLTATRRRHERSIALILRAWTSINSIPNRRAICHARSAKTQSKPTATIQTVNKENEIEDHPPSCHSPLARCGRFANLQRPVKQAKAPSPVPRHARSSLSSPRKLPRSDVIRDTVHEAASSTAPTPPTLPRFTLYCRRRSGGLRSACLLSSRSLRLQ